MVKERRMLYVIAVKKEDYLSCGLGIYKKINAQKKVLEENNVTTELYEGIILPKWKRIMPFGSSSIDWKGIKCPTFDYVYIRYPYADYRMIQFLKKIRKDTPNIKIILEIPTYPYDSEIKKTNIKYIRDYFYRKYLQKYIDRVVIFANSATSIYNIPTINTMNGVDLNKISKKKETNSQSINVCAVANFSWWHGIDRFIEGMIKYYIEGGKRDINLFLVGPNNQTLQQLLDMPMDSVTKQHIKYMGALSGKELENLYNKCNFAIECLGLFRKDKDMISSSLKSREYLAKGIPFIYSGEIDVLKDKDYEYSMKAENDNSPIDMQEVISFFERIYISGEKEVIEKIRNFAENNIEITRTMQPLIEYLKKDYNSKKDV